MIIVEINDSVVGNKTYPYIGQYIWVNQLKVLFTSHNTGTVIGPTEDWIMEEVRSVWTEEKFKQFHGTITLTQD